MSRNPTVLIGLGGTGTTIVTRVRRRLLAMLADQPTLRQSLVDRRFQFLAFDTWVDSTVPDDLVRRGQLRATGDTPLNVIVQQKKASPNDRFFERWWPYGTYDYPGDISNGAGRVRIVGKAATYLDIIGGGVPTAGPMPFDQMVANAINNAYAFKDADGVQGYVSVFIVSGLAGGTGSGATLLLANYLKPKLPQGTQLIGTFLLPSIMALADTQHGPAIYANGFAALKELDWWMLPEAWRKTKTVPFIELPDGGGHGTAHHTVLRGDQPPFDWCYLFSRYNSQSLCLASYDEYLDLAADCLRLQLYSTDFDLVGPGANFHNDMKQIGAYSGRSRAYASAVVASLEFPVESVTRYLALEYGQRLLNEWFLSPADSERLGKKEADDFCSSHRLDKAEAYGELRKEFFQRVEEFAETPDPAIRPALLAAGKRETRRAIVDQMTNAETWLARRESIAGVNVARLQASVQADLAALLERVLSRPAGDGFEVAHEALKQLRSQIAVLDEALQVELAGSAAKNVPGLRAELAEMQQAPQPSMRRGDHSRKVPVPGTLEWHIQEIEGGHDKHLFGHVTQRKERFLEEWWKPWLQRRRDVLLCEKGLVLLRTVSDRVSVLLGGMEAVQDLLQDIKEDYRTGALAALVGQATPTGRDAEQAQPWTLADRIYCQPDWLREDFLDPEPLDPAITHLLLVEADRGVLSQLRQYWTVLAATQLRKTDLEKKGEAAKRELSELLQNSCIAKFTPKVAMLSVWDALVREAEKNHLVNPTDQVAYIQTKLTALVGRAGPFWRPDSAVLSDHPALSRTNSHPGDRMVAVSQMALDAFVARVGPPAAALKNALPNILGLPPRKSTQDFDDSHQIYLFIRDGGLPLRALDPDELKRMEENGKQHTATSNIPIYTDRRYEAALPPGFDFFEDDQAYYLLVMAMHFKFITYGSNRTVVKLQEPGKRATDLFPGDGLRGMEANFTALRADFTLQDTVGKLVNQAWQGVPRGRESDEVQTALTLVNEELTAAGSEKERREFWKKAETVLQERLERGEFAVRVTG